MLTFSKQFNAVRIPLYIWLKSLRAPVSQISPSPFPCQHKDKNYPDMEIMCFPDSIDTQRVKLLN